MRTFARTKKVILGSVALALVLTAGPASAKNDGDHGNGGKPPPVTKIRFHLDDHQVTVGESLTSDVSVASHAKGWEAFEGASLSVRIDGVEVGTLVTDATGQASLTVPVTEAGGGVIRVVFLGDELHKRAWRAQGFHAAAAEEPPVEEPPVEEPPVEEPPVEPVT